MGDALLCGRRGDLFYQTTVPHRPVLRSRGLHECNLKAFEVDVGKVPETGTACVTNSMSISALVDHISVKVHGTRRAHYLDGQARIHPGWNILWVVVWVSSARARM